jgi:hypothetical protein
MENPDEAVDYSITFSEWFKEMKDTGKNNHLLQRVLEYYETLCSP